MLVAVTTGMSLEVSEDDVETNDVLDKIGLVTMIIFTAEVRS